MQKKICKLLLIGIIILMSVNICFAAEDSTYTVSGQVVDGEGNPVSGVKLVLKELEEIIETNEEGKWSKEGVKEPVEVIPIKPGCEFTPEAKIVSREDNKVTFIGLHNPEIVLNNFIKGIKEQDNGMIEGILVSNPVVESTFSLDAKRLKKDYNYESVTQVFSKFESHMGENYQKYTADNKNIKEASFEVIKKQLKKESMIVKTIVVYGDRDFFIRNVIFSKLDMNFDLSVSTVNSDQITEPTGNKIEAECKIEYKDQDKVIGEERINVYMVYKENNWLISKIVDNAINY